MQNVSFYKLDQSSSPGVVVWANYGKAGIRGLGGV
jgi:hypothetical protein